MVSSTKLKKRIIHTSSQQHVLPLGGGTRIISNKCGCVRGSSILSFKSAFTSSIPPIADQGTFGTSTATDLMADGFVMRMAWTKSLYLISKDIDGKVVVDPVYRVISSGLGNRDMDNRTASLTANLQSAPVNPFARRANALKSVSSTCSPDIIFDR
jgi:hypothetical protein